MTTMEQIRAYVRDWANLQRFVSDRVEENQHLDFKDDPYQHTRSDRRELRRDATALAPPFDPLRVTSKVGPGGRGVVIVQIPCARTGYPHAVAENTRPLEFWVRRDKSKRQTNYTELRNAFLTDPTIDYIRRSLEQVDQAWHKLSIQPIHPPQFHGDAFLLRGIEDNHIRVVKEASSSAINIPLTHIDSINPRPSGNMWDLLLKDVVLTSDGNRWDVRPKK